MYADRLHWPQTPALAAVIWRGHVGISRGASERHPVPGVDETARQPGQGARPVNWSTASSAESILPAPRCPPEPALCETFSVSRTVVREAVKVLQEKGLVQVRQGSGTIVTPSTE